MRCIGINGVWLGVLAFAVSLCAGEGADKQAEPAAKAEKYVVGSKKPAEKKVEVKEAAPAQGTQKTPTEVTKKAPAETKPSAAPAKAAKGPADSLVIVARVVEIPGKFAPNDLYNYVYVMKYRVLEVVSGAYAAKEIYVGHYNPLIPRARLKDKMAAVVKGDVEKFEVGGKHRLVLSKPIEKYWNDAKEDEYIDIDDSEKYFALRADIAK